MIPISPINPGVGSADIEKYTETYIEKKGNQISNLLVFLSWDRLNMIVMSSLMLEKYSRITMRIQVVRPRRNFFPKPSQIHPKTSPEHVQASPNMSQTSRKSEPDMTKK